MARATRLALGAVLSMMVSCAKPDVAPEAALQPQVSTNMVLISEFTGPYNGVPAFDQMNLDDLVPAIEAAMALEQEEIQAIAENPDPPTFDNTIVALDRAGRPMSNLYAYYGVWRSNLSSDRLRQIQAQMAPKMAAHWTSISQNEALFARIQAVHEGDEVASLRPDQQRLVQLKYEDFALSGATLRGEEKARYKEISERLAELHTTFGNNVLADEEGIVHFLTEDQLGGLSESIIAAAGRAATEREREGEYAITNTRSSMEPFLTHSDERDLREQVWRAYYNRADNGDANDNNAVIAEILKLRHERSQLLGFDDYASWRLTNRMAQSPERALELMEAVWPAALARVAEEVADMQAIADAEGAGITIAPWDYRYYAEKVRQDRYDLDSEQVRAYLQLDNLREAMFFVAGELFGFAFTPIEDGSVPVFHPDMTVFEVTDRASGAHVGLWYLDPFARPGKRSGAWATTYRRYDIDEGRPPSVLASNNSNFIPGAPGEPVLISWTDAETLFHEFGHALHSLSSRAPYPGLSGAVRDYVEFQSQLLERWLLTEPVINGYLLHHQTGEPIPAELVEKIKNSATFNQGFQTAEYLASALVDMRYHTTDPTDIDPDAFERETLASLEMPDEIVMRHRSPHFGHIFGSEGYAAGYYGYLWAEVLTADAAEAFASAPGGYYDADVAAKLVEHLFQAQNAVPPEDAYQAFRGRDAAIDALMRDRGFPASE